jgi:UDPglucose--hexose-1-phosphate uridylyltransferase
VIVAPDRAKRPNAFVRASDAASDDDVCPFCEGNEQMTPPEVFAPRPAGGPANGPGWSLRVFPNKFPMVQRGVKGSGVVSPPEGLLSAEAATGVHEALVETSRHETSMARLPEAEIADVLAAFRSRLIKIKRDRKIRYVLIFKNQGRAAGASLEHTHSQLLGLSKVPEQAERSLRTARRHYTQHGRCLLCEILQTEIAAGERVIDESNAFVALSKHAARFPYESRICPRSHQSTFEGAPVALLAELAAMLRRLLRALEHIAPQAAYNLMLHTAPAGNRHDSYWHWYLELSPRLTGIAGFELATDWHTNQVTPEQAAQQLREAIAESGSVSV